MRYQLISDKFAYQLKIFSELQVSQIPTVDLVDGSLDSLLHSLASFNFHYHDVDTYNGVDISGNSTKNYAFYMQIDNINNHKTRSVFYGVCFSVVRVHTVESASSYKKGQIV